MYIIKSKVTIVKNPQAIVFLERTHQLVGKMLRSKYLESHDFDYRTPWSEILAIIAWDMHNTVHTILQATPGQPVFGRDIIFCDT